MQNTSRAMRATVSVSPDFLMAFSNAQALYHETYEDIELGLEWGQRKKELLRWVRREMRRRLTPRERRCIELHFFEGFTCREVGVLTGTSTAAAHRAIERALRKLREAVKRRRDKSGLYGPRPRASDCEGC